MSAPEAARRVALLARPGAARDSVRGALLEVGADVVAEADPTVASPDTIRDASPDVLMIVLDAVSEGALDRFDSMLGDPGIEVMFEEADVAAGRDGWEAARWRRHLAAKLHHRDDVLPPVAGAELVPAVDPLAMRIEDLVAGEPDESPLADTGTAEVVELPADAVAGDDFSVFDPVAAEAGDETAGYVLSVHGLELDASAPDDLSPVGAGLDLDSTGLEFDSVALDTPSAGLDLESAGLDELTVASGLELDAVALDTSAAGLELESTAFDALPPVASGLELDSAALDALPPSDGPDFTASDFDPLLAELDAELPDLPLPAAPALAESEWQGGLVEGFGDTAPPSALELDADLDATPVAPVPPPLPSSGFGELSLADDAAPMPSVPGAARPVDLDALERRIAALELVDDAPKAAAPPALDDAVPDAASLSTPEPAPAAHGIALVLAGIGGPDAVRQFLGALPARFRGAVLVRQRLDGARYDKLVAQMQRASALPVVLAVPGEMIRGGHVYVLGDDVGIADGAITFTAGGAGELLERLPADRGAVVVLSGADAGEADRIASLQMDGAFVGAQAAEGCYDASAATAVATRAGVTDAPPELARRIVDRWT